MIFSNFVDALALPRLIWLKPNLIGIAFSLMKLLPARLILRRAEKSGELVPGALIAESTSGTFGLALAMLSRLKGYQLFLVSDPAIDSTLQRRLEDLGASVHIVKAAAQSGGYQKARLDFLSKVLQDHPSSFWPRQYSNPCNPESYAECAEELVRAIGQIDCLVGTVGSGGSMCGLSSYLRLLFPDLSVIGVDTHGSVLFGLADKGANRSLRGLGNSIIPPIIDHTIFDWVHWVASAEAFRATRALHREHSLFMGPTSGAAYLVASWWAARNPDALTAVILPDEGHRYSSTVYDDTWLAAKQILLDRPILPPVQWDRPCERSDPWAYFSWNRNSYADVTGAQAAIGNLVLAK